MATPWTTISVSDLEDYLMAPQLTALRNAARGETQDDPLPAIIQDAITHVRRKIASCSRNRMDDADNTVPPSLKTQAIYVALFRAQVRIPVLKLTDDQTRAYQDAQNDLNRVASCQDGVEQPDDAVDADVGALTPTTEKPIRRYDHASQDGI